MRTVVKPGNLRGATPCGKLFAMEEHSAEELETFKRGIDLVAYATHVLGYAVDRRSPGSARLRKGGDVVIVARDRDGHFIYFSPLDDADNGTIIDFVQRRRRLSLGQVRKELRPWIGMTASPSPQAPGAVSVPMAATGRKELDRLRVASQLEVMQVALSHRYLAARAVEEELLAHPRFAGCVLEDGRGNAIFPHRDSEGFTGYEIKNVRFTGFSRGSKALWHSNAMLGDGRLVISESAIDALSHFVLHRCANTRYVSTAGGWGPRVDGLLLSTAHRLGEPREVFLAFDNDDAGMRYVEKCRALFATAGMACIAHLPTEPGTDWNDVLRQARSGR